MADLSDSWKDRPPVQWMVQGYMGIKPRSDAKAPTEQECSDFLATMAAKAKP